MMTELSRFKFPPPNTHTERFLDISTKDILDGEKIIAAKQIESQEQRGQLSVWEEMQSVDPEKITFISSIDDETISVNDNEHCISLRDSESLKSLIKSERLLIDVTSLPHNIWAPLLKAAHDSSTSTRILYAEPESYKEKPTPASATLFDLSTSFGGLAPIPGFTKLDGPEDESKCLFVALLGFEGNRPERLVFQIDPVPPKVIPFVGVPGFQAEFPTYTVACNRNFLNDYNAYSELKYVRASCPFEVYEGLKQLEKDYPGHYMYLAPVGTKPHSLGAILYAIKNPDRTEIMFDYPNKKKDRTKGVGIIHIYNFGNFHDI